MLEMEMTDTKPTLEEQIEHQIGICYGTPSKYERAKLASLEELQSIKSQPVPEENWLMKPALEWLEEAEHGADKDRCKMIADMLRYLWNHQSKITSDATQPVPVEPMSEMWLAGNRLPQGIKLYPQKAIDSLQSALQVAQQERDGWMKLSPCELMAGNASLLEYAQHFEKRAEKAEADHKAAEQNVSDLMAEIAQTGALLMKAEAENKRLVELLRKTQDKWLDDADPLECQELLQDTDKLLREVGK